jgi:hypothetical protein
VNNLNNIKKNNEKKIIFESIGIIKTTTKLNLKKIENICLKKKKPSKLRRTFKI